MTKGGRGGAGRGNGAGARQGRGAKKARDPTVPGRRVGETGACVELGNHIFTISSGNKARDGDTLRTTKEAMTLYIGTHYGEDSSKEFSTGVVTKLSIPPQDATISTRHALRVQAHLARLNKKIANLQDQQTAILAAIVVSPTDRSLLREKMEVEDELSKAQFEITEELEVVLTLDEKAERSNVFRTYREDEQRLINNRGKVYALILGQCTQTLKDKLKEDSDWEDIAGQYDAIRLLQLIEKFVLKQTESHYPYLAVQEEMRSMLNFSQGEDMTLGMYYEKFNTRVSIADRAGCTFVSESLLEVETELLYSGFKYENLQSSEKAKVEKTARDKYLAVLFLMRSGKRHLQLQNDIKNDHAKGVEHSFPTTVASAMQIMNDFKPVITESPKAVSLGTAFAQTGNKKAGKGRLTDEQWNALSPEEKTALVAKRKADKAKKDAGSGNGKKSPKKEDDDASVRSTKSMVDLEKDNLRLKRQLKSTKAALVTTLEEGDESDLSDDEGSSSFNAGLAIVGNEELHEGIVMAQTTKALNLRRAILIDSQTTHDVFCNKDYVENVRRAKKVLHLSTNGGGMTISQEADVVGLYPDGDSGCVYYDSDAITNILSFKKLAKTYRITYDSDVAKTFTVHRSCHGLVDLHFTMHPCGLHVLEQENAGVVFIQTVEDNMKLYTKRQIAGATKARNLYENLLCPSVEDFHNIISTGRIIGCQVTLEDAKTANKIWGPSVSRSKGNTTRKRAQKAISSVVSVPKELIKAQKDVTICIDFFYVNQTHIFLMTYSMAIVYTTTSHVVSRKVKDYWSILKDIYMMYYVRGLRIVTIRADLEFSTLQALVGELPTNPTMELAAQGEHVGPVERNIRFLKEKVRSLRHTLPFEKVPKYMLIHMVFAATKVMNMFPRRGGNKYYSPGAIMTEKGVSVDDLKIAFGSYVQSTNSSLPHNSLETRSRGAIWLGMMGNATGGHIVLSLDTGKLLRPSHVTVVTMTEAVVARVNFLGRGEKSLLTFQNRKGEEIGESLRLNRRSDENSTDEMVDLEEREGYSDTVEHVTGVESPYEEYVDEWNEVPEDSVEREVQGGDVVDQGIFENPVYTNQEESEFAGGDYDTGVDEYSPTPQVQEAEVIETPSTIIKKEAGNDRPTRVRKPVERLLMSFKGKSYGSSMAQVSTSLAGLSSKASIELLEKELTNMGSCDEDATMCGIIMAHMSVKQATKEFGADRTKRACEAEVKQIHMRNTFVPKHRHELTTKQKARMVESFIFLTEKRSGEIKARKVLGGNVQRDYISKDEASSPTAYTEAVILTAVIDAKEKRDVATIDIPNAFCQTVISDEDAEHRIIVRLRGPVVDILCEIAPEVYSDYVTTNKKGEKILLVQCMNALYGSMIASVLFYKKLVASLKGNGFTLNPYDPCVANKTVEGGILTICFHVDDCKISHRATGVVDKTIDWLRNDYEVLFEDGSGAMKVHRGRVHDYLGMTLDFSHEGELHISMVKYIVDIYDSLKKAQDKYFSEEFVEVRKRGKSQLTAAPENLFVINEECDKLTTSQREAFHSCVAKALYFAKRARPDILPSIAFLTKRVKAPDVEDWAKLVHMVTYLHKTQEMPLILSADGSDSLYWYADSAFGVHPDMKSHTGAGLTLGRGFAISISTGQKLNTGSSTYAELVAVSDILPLVQWVRLFLLSQGVKLARNIIYQDNKSAVLLEENGKKSSGKRTRHLNIRYFLVTDAIARKECEIKWIPREGMYADYMTKAQVGAEFRCMRDFVMGAKSG